MDKFGLQAELRESSIKPSSISIKNYFDLNKSYVYSTNYYISSISNNVINIMLEFPINIE